MPDRACAGSRLCRIELAENRHRSEFLRGLLKLARWPRDARDCSARLQVSLRSALRVRGRNGVDSFGVLNQIIAAQAIGFDVEYDLRDAIRGLQPFGHSGDQPRLRGFNLLDAGFI